MKLREAEEVLFAAQEIKQMLTPKDGSMKLKSNGSFNHPKLREMDAVCKVAMQRAVTATVVFPRVHKKIE